MIKRSFFGLIALTMALLLCACALADTLNIDLGAPLYLQKDKRWRDVLLNTDYSQSKTIGEAGCTLCCLAMAEAVRTGQAQTPAQVAAAIEFSGDELHWPRGYEAIARSKDGMLMRQAGPILTACITSGRPALVCLTSDTLGTHWVMVYGSAGLNPDDPQTAHFLIRDPGTKDRTTFNMTKEFFPRIRVIRTYDVDDALRAAVAEALAE